MRFKVVQDKPRPLARCGLTVSSDARWRGVPKKVTSIDTMRRLELQQRQRDKTARKRG